MPQSSCHGYLRRKYCWLADGEIVAWFSAPMITTGLVARVQVEGRRAGVCCKEKVAELVGQERMNVFVPVRKMRRDGGVIGASGLKAATCISHAPELSVAVALKEPTVLAI